MKKHYTMTWNRAKSCFVASVRKPNGSGWMKKWLPKGLFLQHQSLEAESWLITWLADFTKNNIAPGNTQVSNRKTLALYLPRWLELRRKSLGTGLNTYWTYDRCSKWILDDPKIIHFSIQDLDIVEELSNVTVIRTWIQSLGGAMNSRIQVISTLSTFFNDAVAEGWLDEEFVNPMQKRAIVSMIRELKELRRKTVDVKTVPWNEMLALINEPHHKIRAIRRLRYLVAVSTGLRDAELQGLIWSDIHLDEEIPYLRVSRQLFWHGKKPIKVYEKELAKGRDKLSILQGENAVVSEPKTRSSSGTVPLHPVTVEALKAHYQTTEWKAADDPVFSLEGRFYHTRAETLQDDMKRLKLNTDGITFHAIRRSFASKLSSVGVDDGTIERLLRHSKQSVARVHYIHDDLVPLYVAVCKLPLGSGATKTDLESKQAHGHRAPYRYDAHVHQPAPAVEIIGVSDVLTKKPVL
jgi:integrase